jgi:hypothetical protein
VTAAKIRKHILMEVDAFALFLHHAFSRIRIFVFTKQALSTSVALAVLLQAKSFGKNILRQVRAGDHLHNCYESLNYISPLGSAILAVIIIGLVHLPVA